MLRTSTRTMAHHVIINAEKYFNENLKLYVDTGFVRSFECVTPLRSQKNVYINFNKPVEIKELKHKEIESNNIYSSVMDSVRNNRNDVHVLKFGYNVLRINVNNDKDIVNVDISKIIV